MQVVWLEVKVTPPRRIGAVSIPRPWESEGDLRRLQGLDLHEMGAAQLERERQRLDVALGIVDDAELVEPMYVLSGATPMTVGMYLEGRRALVSQLLASRCDAP